MRQYKNKMEAKSMHQQKHIKISSFIICLILMLNLIFGTTPVYAAGDVIVLNGPDESANKVFTSENMFPSDEIYKDYVLNISHKENIDIMFRAEVQNGYEILAEVLKLRVEIPGVTTLYDGLMKDMPTSCTYTLSGREQKVTYRLTVYLETSVGNKSATDPDGKRYQNKDLKADFSWWYMPESTVGGTGGGGYNNGGSFRPDDDPEKDTTKMLRRAYVIGRPNNYFEPEAPITRAETATIFARIFADYNEENLTSTHTKFKDVADTEWFAKYISRCENENIIFGYNGHFRPSDNITRAEFAATCVRFFENRSESTIKPADISFTDFESSHWAYDTIKKAYANGYVSGYPDKTLRADNTITRAEAVTIVNRMLERIPDKEYIDNNLDKLIDFIDVRDNAYWAYYDIFEAANTHYIRFVNNFAKWVD